MKTGPTILKALRRGALLLGILAGSFVAPCGAAAAPVRLEFRPEFGGAPLGFDAPTLTTAFGQKISVTRLDLLLSDFALRDTEGHWHADPNRFACLRAREGRTNFTLAGLPHGSPDRLRFHVGVPPAENHADPGGYAADHPLNPNVNGLHWNWQGGYVFLALEGRWGGNRGYAFHLATDPLLTLIEMPLPADYRSGGALRLVLDVEQLFRSPHHLILSEAASSTHSRTGDLRALRLRDNLAGAFLLRAAPAAEHLEPARSEAAPRPLVAPGATPYRFTFPGYFPRPALPADNPLTEEGVALGRRLFHDPQLSSGNRQSCATCHQAASAFADAGRRFSLGADGQAGARNSMPLFNLAWKSSFFWDGRAPSLRAQVLQPIENPAEMHESLPRVVARLADAAEGSSAGYPAAFAAAFGSPEINPDRLARALEQFLLTQVSARSKFDQVLAGTARFSAEEQRGFELFHTEYDPRRGQFGADCFHCHGGPLFQSQSFANNGLDPAGAEPGRFAVTARDGDRGKFSVPSLRNLALTAPYMHDGRFATLEEVIGHYGGGVHRSATLDPNLAKHPDGGVPLSPADRQALVAFLQTLNDQHPPPDRSQVRVRPTDAE